MAGLGALVVSLTAETAAFHRDMERAAYSMNKHAGDMARSMRGVGDAVGQIDAKLAGMGTSLRALGGMVAGGGLVVLLNQSIETLAALDDLSESTGVAVETLAGMEPAAAMAGKSMADVGGWAGKLSKSLNEAKNPASDAARALSAIGISAAELPRLLADPGEAMVRLAGALQGYERDGNLVAAMQAILGKSAGDAVPFLNKLAETGIVAGRATAEQAAEAERLKDALALMNLKSQDLGRTIATALLPHLNGIVSAFASMNSGKSESVGFWDAVGEAMRIAALAGATVWTAIKNIAADLIAVGKTALAVASGDFASIKAIWEQRNATVEANTESLVAFHAELSKGSSLLNTLAGTETKVAAATESAAAATSKLRVSYSSTAPVVDELEKKQKAFMDRLREQSETFGKGEFELLRYQAAQLKLSAAAEPFIAKLEREKRALAASEAARKAGIKAIEEMESAYERNAKAAVASETALQEMLQDMEFESRLIGMTNNEREREIMLRQIQKNSIGLTADKLGELTAQMERELAAMQARRAAFENAEAVRSVWLNMAQDIGQALEGWIMSGFRNGAAFGKSVVQSLKQAFATLFLRPLIQGGLGSLLGAFGANPAAAAGGGGAGGLLSGIGSLFGGGGGSLPGWLLGSIDLGTSAGLGFSGFLGGLASPLSTIGLLATEGIGAFGGLAGALGATLGAALPVVGVLLAVAAAFGAFDRGGPKSGGFAGNIPGMERFVTPNDQDAAVQTILEAQQTAYDQMLRRFGGRNSAGNFAFAFDTDPQGDAGSRVWAAATVNGQSVYNVAGRDVGRDEGAVEAALQTESRRALLAALQASDIPEFVGAWLRTLDAASASDAAIDRVFKIGDAFAAVHEVLNADPISDAAELLAAQSDGSTGAFARAGDGVRKLVEAFDGSEQAFTDLASATQAYYSAQVQLLAQIEQVRNALSGPDGLFQSTIRNMRLSTLDDAGKWDFLEAETETLRQRLAAATDPEEIARLSQRIVDNLNQGFGLLSPDEQRARLADFETWIADLEALTTERLDAVRDETIDETQEILTLVRETFNDAVNAFATSSANSAAAQQAAAALQLAAAQTPIEVRVRVDDGIVNG